MRPRADEVLKSASWTFDEHILPAVQGDFPKSLALTVSNLLRHVLLRLENEGPALIEDNAELRCLLGEIATYVASLDAAPPELLAMHPTLADASRPTSTCPPVGLVALSDEADVLRGHLDAALKLLQKYRPALVDQPAYGQVRDRIRTYLDNQLTRQSAWIQDAFTIDRR